MNYDHLRGKVLIVKNGLSTTKAMIVDADPDIGFTIVDEEDHDEYLQCLIGPVAFKAKWGKDHPDLEGFKDSFNKLVADAKKGIYVLPNFVEMLAKGVGTNPTSEDCAFNV